VGLEAYRAEKRAQNRQAILDAAVQAFVEHGYDRTSLEQVARLAGLSSATLYKHFPTKAELFGAIMGHIWSADAGEPGLAEADLPPAEALFAVGMAYARLLRSSLMAPLFRVVIAEAPRFPELGEELYRRGKEPYLVRLHAYFERQVERGTLSVPDIPLATRQFLGMINDVIFWPRLLLPELAVDTTEAERVVQEAVTTLLARYAPPAKGSAQ
jgi:AcrR family transcriptional regulator